MVTLPFFSKIALYFKLNHFKLIHLQANMLSSFIFTYFAGIVHTNQGQTYQFFVFNLTITWFQDRPCGYRSPRGNFVHYNFLKLHYIRHKIKYVSPLRVAALTCNIMFYYITKLKDRFSLAKSARVASLHIVIFTGWRALAGEY